MKMKEDMSKLLRSSISALFLLFLFLGCKKDYPDDLSVGKYEVTGRFVYPNDSIVTEVLIYYGPQKSEESLKFTSCSGGWTRLISFSGNKLDSGNLSFQIENLNSGLVSFLSCSFEKEELQDDYLKVNFTTKTQQGDINFLSGTLTFKKI